MCSKIPKCLGASGMEDSAVEREVIVSHCGGRRPPLHILALTCNLLLLPLPKCCDLGFHASLARTFRTYLSAEYNLETSRHEGLDVIENAVDNLDSRSDKHTVMDMCNQVFCPPLKFEFQPHMGDEVGFSLEPGLGAASLCSPMCSRTSAQVAHTGSFYPRPGVKLLVHGLPQPRSLPLIP